MFYTNILFCKNCIHKGVIKIISDMLIYLTDDVLELVSRFKLSISAIENIFKEFEIYGTTISIKLSKTKEESNIIIQTGKSLEVKENIITIYNERSEYKTSRKFLNTFRVCIATILGLNTENIENLYLLSESDIKYLVTTYLDKDKLINNKDIQISCTNYDYTTHIPYNKITKFNFKLKICNESLIKNNSMITMIHNNRELIKQTNFKRLELGKYYTFSLYLQIDKSDNTFLFCINGKPVCIVLMKFVLVDIG